MNLSHVGTLQNEVKRCNLRGLNCEGYLHVQTMLHSKMISNVNCKGNIHCNQRGQPSYAAVEGEGRIVLHHEPSQEQLYDSTEGLR